MSRGSQLTEAFAEEEKAALSAAVRAKRALGLVRDTDDATPAMMRPAERALLGVLLGVALIWMLALAWIAIADPAAGPLTPSAIAKGVAYASSPLVLVGVAVLLLLRTSRREAMRFADVAAIVRAESVGLNTTLSIISNRLAADRAAIAETTEKLVAAGDDATERLARAHAALAQETAEFTRQAQTLDESAAAARLDIGVLLADLPQADSRLREMAAVLRDAGEGAHQRAAALESVIAAIQTKARDGEEQTTAAAVRLGAELARIEAAGRSSAARIEDSSRLLGESIDGALGRADAAVARTREGVAAQGDAMMRLVAQSGDAMAQAGNDATAMLARRLDAMRGDVDRLTSLLTGQAEASAAMLARIDSSVTALETRLATLDAEAPARIATITGAIERVGGEAGRVRGLLDESDAASATLAARAGALRAELTALLDQASGALPRAFELLAQKAEHGRASARAVTPDIERLAAAAAGAAAQVDAIDARLAGIASGIDASAGRAQALATEVDAAERAVAALGEAANGALVDALGRVRDSASQAALRAREAFAEIIPASAAMLADETRSALEQAMGEQVEAQLGRVGALSQAALANVAKASDRLGRQLSAMEETTRAIEERADEAQASIEAADRESFSRRAALLIEALNSNAIVITRSLSADVGDEAWDAYLRGDRGVFTRRAVKLLDSGEARQIGRLYESDDVFREQLNRYVHDFEAMLRPLLATGNGGAIGVALLSSDMGKLYVALAQAIERIRT